VVLPPPLPPTIIKTVFNEGLGPVVQPSKVIKVVFGDDLAPIPAVKRRSDGDYGSGFVGWIKAGTHVPTKIPAVYERGIELPPPPPGVNKITSLVRGDLPQSIDIVNKITSLVRGGYITVKGGTRRITGIVRGQLPQAIIVNRISAFEKQGPPPPIPPAEVLPPPSQDTIRGGKEVQVTVSAGATILIDESEDQSFTGAGLPPPWTSSVSGGLLLFSDRGVVLETGNLASSSVSVESAPDYYEHFDVAIDLELLASPVVSSARVDIATFEFRIDVNNWARVVLRTGEGAEPNRIHAVGELSVVPGEGFVRGTSSPLADTSGKLTLRIVRNGAHVWGFVGRRDTRGLYTELVPVFDYEYFAASLGQVVFQSANLTTTTSSITRWSNLTFRAHSTIDGQLLDEKITFGTRRLFGNVPATTLDRRGFRDVALFGLFGEAIGVNAFEYTLPPPLTVGRRGPEDRLRVFLDAVLKDLVEGE
jgi:hypothetical protein